MLLSADAGSAIDPDRAMLWSPLASPTVDLSRFVPADPAWQTCDLPVEWSEQGSIDPTFETGAGESAEVPPYDAVPVDHPPAPAVRAGLIRVVRDYQAGMILADEAGNTRTSTPGPIFDVALSTGGGLSPQMPTSPLGPWTPDDQAPDTWPVDPPLDVPFGPPSPEEMATMPMVPWTRDYTVNGTLASGETSTVFRIPVGPVTNMIKLGLKAEEGPEGHPMGVKVDQVYLMGPNGKVLAAIAGVSYMSDEAGQTLFISIHGAPRGGELVVRVIQTSEPQPIETGGAFEPPEVDHETPSEPWNSAPFELNVQRNDASPRESEGRTLASVGTVGVGPAYIIYMPTATQDPPPAPSAAGDAQLGKSGGEAPAGGPVADRVRTSSTASNRDDMEISDEEEGPSVFLGPLISRTAAALGPALATSTEDPTPSTARGSRPGPEAGDVLGDHDLGLYLGFASSRARRAASDRAAADDAPREAGGEDMLASLRGAGGVPILVSGLGRHDARKEARALAEGLERRSDVDELIAEALEADSALDPDSSRVEIARAGLATRAVGFLIGLGLATGPLYPDLVALARRKLPRKARRARGRRLTS